MCHAWQCQSNLAPSASRRPGDSGDTPQRFMHLPEGACSKHPLMQRETAHAKRILEVLMRVRTVAIDRDGETMNAKSGLQRSSS